MKAAAVKELEKVMTASAKLLSKTEEELAKTKERLKVAEARAAAVAKVTAAAKPTVVDLTPQLSLMELAAKTFSDHAAIVELVCSTSSSIDYSFRFICIARIEHKTKKRCFKEFSIDPDF